MNTRFCIDCRHSVEVASYLPSIFGTFKRKGQPLCGHPSMLSPVDGEPHMPCMLTRLRQCGESGALFDPKNQPSVG